MNFFVLTVVSILVSTTNCRVPPDGPDISNDVLNLAGDGRDLTGGHGLPNGPDDEASMIEPVLFSNRAGDLSFSAEDVEVGASIVDVGFGVGQSGFDNNDSPFVDQQLKEDVSEENERKLRGVSKCKSAIVCSLLGGSCVTNSTYCSGREVPSVCNGAKCKCCIPVNLEVKIHDLENEVKSMAVNLTAANVNILSDMKTLWNSIKSNITMANSNMKHELQFIKETMSNTSSIQDAKLDSISDQQDTIKAQFNKTFQSIQNDITIGNSNLNTKLQNLKTSISNVNSTLVNQGCPKGTFLFTPSNQCFRVLNDTTRNFDSAKSACSALGLQLAHPNAPLALRSYLVTKYGSGWVWINGRGSGSYITWQDTGNHITSSNPLWYSSRPGSYTSTSYCLALMTTEYYWKTYSTTPYYNTGCSSGYWSLCEYVRG